MIYIKITFKFNFYLGFRVIKDDGGGILSVFRFLKSSIKKGADGCKNNFFK